MVKVIRTWECVVFRAKDKLGNEVKIDLEFHRQKREYRLFTANEESVSFKGDSLSEAKLKIKCLSVAVKYIEDYIIKNPE